MQAHHCKYNAKACSVLCAALMYIVGTTQLYIRVKGYIGVILGLYRGYIVIMEKKMETTNYIYIYIYIRHAERLHSLSSHA